LLLGIRCYLLISLRHRIQTGTGTHPIFYSMGTRDFFPGGKAAGVWSWPLTCL